VCKRFWVVLVLGFVAVYILNLALIKFSYKDINSLKDTDSKFVEVCGINIHYKEFGLGNTAILLIHGFGASTFSFREIFAPLSKNYKVIALDLPGFGLTERVLKSSCKFDPYSRIGQVEVVKNFVETLKLGKVFLVGHSMGGVVATILTIEYPDLVQGIVLEDPAIYDTGGSPSFLKVILRSPVGKFLFPLFTYPMVLSLQGLIKKAYFNSLLVTNVVLGGYKKSLKVKNWDYGLYRILTAKNQMDFIDKLSQINIPTLVITGKNDQVVKPENSEKLAATIKNVHLVEIENCGHIPHEETPESFVDAVYRFILQVESSSLGVQ